MYVLFLFHALVIPEKLVELIRRDYKRAALCPFPWCEDELQLKLSNIFTRLQIVSRRKERSQLTEDTVKMTEVLGSTQKFRRVDWTINLSLIAKFLVLGSIGDHWS